MVYKRICIVIFLIITLNGCLYSCNFEPSSNSFNKINDAPCNSDGSITLVSAAAVAGAGQIKLYLDIKMPCNSNTIKEPDSLWSLAVYNKENLQQPEDLENNKTGAFSLGFPCSKADDFINTKNKTQDMIFAGSAVSIYAGKNLDTLYPVYVKFPVSNGGGVDDGKGSCYLPNSTYTKPFKIDLSTYSPIYKNGVPIVGVLDKNIINTSFLLYGHQYVSMGAPMTTYGVRLDSNGSATNTGIKGEASSIGTHFEFDLKIFPGSYYLVLSHVPNPMGAVSGDYSLSDVTVLTATQYNPAGILGGFKNYTEQCNKDIRCGTVYKVS